MTTTKYRIRIDGDEFSMSCREAAIKACQTNATGGTLIAPDGTETPIEHKARQITQYAAGGALEDGPS